MVFLSIDMHNFQGDSTDVMANKSTGVVGGQPDPDSYQDDVDVVKYEPDDLPDSQENLVVVVNFYKPRSKASRQVASGIRKLAKSSRGVIKVGVLDCGVHKQFCSTEKIHKHPTIKVCFRNTAPHCPLPFLESYEIACWA